MNCDFIPASYEQWRHYIEECCRITLTPDYITKRLSKLQNGRDDHTTEFVKSYGSDQHQRIIAWFSQALDECYEKS